jgi:hypothetical protein
MQITPIPKIFFSWYGGKYFSAFNSFLFYPMPWNPFTMRSAMPRYPYKPLRVLAAPIAGNP